MNAKPLDELLFDLALELEATGFVDGPIVATIELPSKVFQRVLGHLACKMVRHERPRPKPSTLCLEIMSDSGRRLIVKPSA